MAGRGEPVKRGERAGERPRLVRQARLVFREIGREQLLEPRVGDARALRLESEADQHAAAAPDELAGFLQRQRSQTLAGENDVERADEVGRAVDERAVEIEDDEGRRGTGLRHDAAIKAGAGAGKRPERPRRHRIFCTITMSSQRPNLKPISGMRPTSTKPA